MRSTTTRILISLCLVLFAGSWWGAGPATCPGAPSQAEIIEAARREGELSWGGCHWVSDSAQRIAAVSNNATD